MTGVLRLVDRTSELVDRAVQTFLIAMLAAMVVVAGVQIDKLSKQTVGAASWAAERALRSLERGVRGSLDGRTTTARRQSAGGTSTLRVRRKVTDPELLERRRQALANCEQAL